MMKKCRVEDEAQPSRGWGFLPPRILTKIQKLLPESYVTVVCLRSICKHWRSVFPLHRPTRIQPLDIPNVIALPIDHRASIDPYVGRFVLIWTIVYRLTPRDGGTSWLFRTWDMFGKFPLLLPLANLADDKLNGTPCLSFDLRDYRISEVCRCYRIKYLRGPGDRRSTLLEQLKVLKVVVLENFSEEGDFIVLTLFCSGRVCYWRAGGSRSRWTPIDVLANWTIADVIPCNGICYAVSNRGVLVSIDSGFRVSVLTSAPHPSIVLAEKGGILQNRLIICDSHLYLVSKTIDVYPNRLKVYKWKWGCWWEQVTDLQGKFFISNEDVSLALSARDFRSSPANSIYLGDFVPNYYGIPPNQGVVYGRHYWIYRLKEGRILPPSDVYYTDQVFWPPNSLGPHYALP